MLQSSLFVDWIFIFRSVVALVGFHGCFYICREESSGLGRHCGRPNPCNYHVTRKG